MDTTVLVACNAEGTADSGDVTPIDVSHDLRSTPPDSGFDDFISSGH